MAMRTPLGKQNKNILLFLRELYFTSILFASTEINAKMAMIRVTTTAAVVDWSTYAWTLQGFVNMKPVAEGKLVHSHVILTGFNPDVFLETKFVNMYAKRGSLVYASRILDEMRIQPDHFTFASILPACANIAALEHGKEVRKPDSDTFVCVLPACANLVALEHGKEVREDIVKSGFEHDVFVGSTFVDMYAKCGSIVDARNVFDRIPSRNVVSWNAMIVGFGVYGCGKEALQLFEELQHSGAKPDHVTFIGVLSACCHEGLVDDVWQNFYSMSRDYYITPTSEHYCCMVDLLGRAGWDDIEKVRKMMQNKRVKKMPGCSWIEVNNKMAWVDKGDRVCVPNTNFVLHDVKEQKERISATAIKYLFELDPKMLQNMCCCQRCMIPGRWDNIEKVWKMMRQEGEKDARMQLD
eukprot:Gb_12466 [translate_table: standard]